MAGVQQACGVRTGRIAVGGHHDALARGEAVVLDHPRRITCRRPEAVECRVQSRRVVDDLASGGGHSRRIHHVLGEGLGAFDARGVLRRSEAGDARGPHRVGDTEHQWHFGADDDEVGRELLGQFYHLFAGGDVDVVLLGDRRRPCVSGRHGDRVDLGVSTEREQQRMFTGTGSDYEDAHGDQP